MSDTVLIAMAQAAPWVIGGFFALAVIVVFLEITQDGDEK